MFDIQGTVTLGGTPSCVVDFNRDTSIHTLVQTGGTLSGSGDVTVTGSLDWDEGNMSGVGETHIALGVTVHIHNDNSNYRPTLLRTLNNSGTATLTGAQMWFERGVFNNLAEGTVVVDSALRSGIYTPNDGTFNNYGIFRKSSQGSEFYFSSSPVLDPFYFNNYGVVEVNGGILLLTAEASYIQIAGETRLSGGSLVSDNLLEIQGGIITGEGQITADVLSNGAIIPGVPPSPEAGRILILGDYSQVSTGELVLEIGGLAIGSFDQLTVNGGGVLDGTLNISVVNGFDPQPGNAFVILENDAADLIDGTFAGLHERTVITVGDYLFEISYEGGDGNDVVLTCVVNRPPFIDDQSFAVEENQTAAGTLIATDPDLPDDTLTYSISGGTDGHLFVIDPVSGEFSFVAAPDFEMPGDFDEDNLYELEVTVTDSAEATASAPVTVSVLNLASITGTVFVDVNGNGLYDANELGIDGVTIELWDEYGNCVTAITEDGGYYQFEDLQPGTYQVHEIQPTGVDDGPEILGSLDGSTIFANDTFQMTLDRTDALDYIFAEIGQEVSSGDTATIGFWQNKHGQALIQEGGAALAEWLTSNFGNVFGDVFTGTSVAKFYRDELFRQKADNSAGPAKVDCQFMAVALATYFTSRNWAGDVATAYGFNVTDTGIKTKVVNVGSNGAAFDVVDGTDLTIMDLLLATNGLTDLEEGTSGFAYIYDRNGDGDIDSLEASLRVMANDLYTMINEQGDF